jgi:hypothetical protein
MRVDIRGVAAGVAAVVAPTGAIFGLRNVAPVLSLGVLYTVAVLPIAIRWGRAATPGRRGHVSRPADTSALVWRTGRAGRVVDARAEAV